MLGRKSLEIEILKKRRGGVSCGAVHSQARELVAHGHTATLVAATLLISRSSLYYRKKPRATGPIGHTTAGYKQFIDLINK
jgi:hypothetical protein